MFNLKNITEGDIMTTRKLTYTALFIALGVIVPQAIHMIGGPSIGTILLPIHLPVFIGAMLLGPLSGVLIAIVSLFIGVILGMPPMPIAVFMLFEMTVYGFVSGYMFKIKKINIYISLITAMILGRLVELGVINVVLSLFEIKLPPVFGKVVMFTAGIPGMILQIILVPILVLTLIRFTKEGEAKGYE